MKGRDVDPCSRLAMRGVPKVALFVDRRRLAQRGGYSQRVRGGGVGEVRCFAFGVFFTVIVSLGGF
jgi:hypothetical protein